MAYGPPPPYPGTTPPKRFSPTAPWVDYVDPTMPTDPDSGLVADPPGHYAVQNQSPAASDGIGNSGMIAYSGEYSGITGCPKGYLRINGVCTIDPSLTR